MGLAPLCPPCALLWQSLAASPGGWSSEESPALPPARRALRLLTQVGWDGHGEPGPAVGKAGFISVSAATSLRRHLGEHARVAAVLLFSSKA